MGLTRRIRLLGVAGALGFFAVGAVASAVPGDERPVLRVLTVFDPVIREAFARVHEFEAEHGCWVDWDWGFQYELESALFDSMERYDLVSVDEPWLPELSPRLLPLDAWPKGPGAGVAEAGRAAWKGRAYGLPVLKNLYLYAYRADILADPDLAQSYARAFRERLEPPETIEDYLRLTRFLHEQTDFSGVATVSRASESLTVDLLWLLKAAGVDLGREEERRNPDQTSIAKAFEWLAELRSLSVPEPRPSFVDDVNAAYGRADVAQVLQWAGHAEPLRNSLFSRIGAETGFRPLPSAEGRQAFFITGDWYLAIPRESAERRALAAAFAQWCAELLRPDAFKAAWVGPDFRDAPEWSRPRLPDYRGFSRLLSGLAAEAAVGGTSPEEAARRLAEGLAKLEEGKREGER